MANEEARRPPPHHSFPFLQLPRVVGDPIYSRALIPPDTVPTASPTPRFQPIFQTSYWGTEKSTRLFPRVNRRVSAEARDTLSVEARSPINKIGFMIIMSSIPCPFTPSDEEKWRQTLEAAVTWPPNIRRIELFLALSGHDVPDWQVEEVVARAMKIASPLKGKPHFSLRGGCNEDKQWTCMVRELREALGVSVSWSSERSEHTAFQTAVKQRDTDHLQLLQKRRLLGLQTFKTAQFADISPM